MTITTFKCLRRLLFVLCLAMVAASCEPCDDGSTIEDEEKLATEATARSV